MERQYFENLRSRICAQNSNVKSGKMMSSDAIVYKRKVFVFFSQKQTMVFKLGKDFNPVVISPDMRVFNPFRKRAPLHGWFELPFTEKELWSEMAQEALHRIKIE